MRIALVGALFMNLTILLLDEPTNHLGESFTIGDCYCCFLQVLDVSPY
jgi:ABC-type polar amino acid transport system ATPase subunit